MGIVSVVGATDDAYTVPDQRTLPGSEAPGRGTAQPDHAGAAWIDGQPCPPSSVLYPNVKT
jgi:hypothetical protein